MHFPDSFICLWPSCHSDLGGSRPDWGLFLEQTEFLQLHGGSADNGELGWHWAFLPAAQRICGFHKRAPAQTPTDAHVTRWWILCVNTGILRKNLHDILSERSQALQQEFPRPQGSSQTVSPRITLPALTSSAVEEEEKEAELVSLVLESGAWSSKTSFSRLTSSRT